MKENNTHREQESPSKKHEHKSDLMQAMRQGSMSGKSAVGRALADDSGVADESRPSSLVSGLMAKAAEKAFEKTLQQRQGKSAVSQSSPADEASVAVAKPAPSSELPSSSAQSKEAPSGDAQLPLAEKAGQPDKKGTSESDGGAQVGAASKPADGKRFGKKRKKSAGRDPAPVTGVRKSDPDMGRVAIQPRPSDIARMKEPRTLSIDDLAMKKIIYPEHPNRAVVDRFKQLKNRLLQNSKGRNFTLTVTSAVNNGGASFVAINLAAAFAFDSSRTALLIDCNLRYPSLHHAFDMVPDLGVTDFLDDPIMDVSSVIYPTGIKRLRFVPAGKRHEPTSEYLTSYRMKQLLETVRGRYPDRFIILDTPPVTELPDAGLLSELTDYTLVVAPHGKVREGRILEACNRVPPEKLTGVVFNH